MAPLAGHRSTLRSSTRRLSKNKTLSSVLCEEDLLDQMRAQLSMPGMTEDNNKKIEEFNDNSTVVTSHSSKSNRSIFPFFSRVRRMNTIGDMNDVVSVTSSKSWWVGHRGKDEDHSTKTVSRFSRFRLKHNNISSKSNKDSQMVADFFDVQSLMSLPVVTSFPSSPNRPAAQTVTSTHKGLKCRFPLIRLKKRNIIGQTVALDDDDDIDEITLGSSFDNVSLVDSVDDTSSHGCLQSYAYSEEHYETICDDSPTDMTPSEVRKITTKNASVFESDLTNFIGHNQQPTHNSNDNPLAGKSLYHCDSNSTLLVSEEVKHIYETHTDNYDDMKSTTDSNICTMNELVHCHIKEEFQSTCPVRAGKMTMPGRASNCNRLKPEVSDTQKQKDSIMHKPREINFRKDSLPATTLQKDADGLFISTRPQSRWDSNNSMSSYSSAPFLPKRPQRIMSNAVVSNLSKQSKQEGNYEKRQPLLSMCMSASVASTEEDFDDDSILSMLGGLLASWAVEREITADEEAELSAAVDDFELFQNDRLRSILKNTLQGSHKKILCEEQKESECLIPSVSFSTIEIREYERVVGDNPSCTRGPPISIGWSYQLSNIFHVDEYESKIRSVRRQRKDFHLKAEQRTQLLVEEWKCDEEDIRKARREVTYIQYCRAKTSFSGSRAAAKEAAFLRNANYMNSNWSTTKPQGAGQPMNVPISPPGSHIKFSPMTPSPVSSPSNPNMNRVTLSTNVANAMSIQSSIVLQSCALLEV